MPTNPLKAGVGSELSYPSQAVILAGGRGTRLRPLTDERPKPMIEFHGKPFLEYLIRMLRENGFRRVLFLLGYLPEVIQDYFGDGRQYGLRIDYSVSHPEDETGRRLHLAKDRIDPVFLLMYGDNFWPMRWHEMRAAFFSGGALAQVTVYRNEDHFTRSNVALAEDGTVTLYDKSRTAPGLKGVDIGFMILKHEVLDLIPQGNVSFEATVYPQLAREHQLKAYLTDHRYYSISTPARLGGVAEFLRRRPAVFLDRDGVLNKKKPRAQYVRSWADWEWLPGAREALRLLKESGYRVILVSNQAGIARGAMTESDLADIHARLRKEARDAGGKIHAIYYCPHGWGDSCECRKPRAGMLFRAQRDFHLDLTRSYFFGDDPRDEEAGTAAGCRTVLVSEAYPLFQAVKEHLIKEEPCVIKSGS